MMRIPLFSSSPGPVEITGKLPNNFEKKVPIFGIQPRSATSLLAICIGGRHLCTPLELFSHGRPAQSLFSNGGQFSDAFYFLISSLYRGESPYWKSRFWEQWIQKTHLVFHKRRVPVALGRADVARGGAAENHLRRRSGGDQRDGPCQLLAVARAWRGHRREVTRGATRGGAAARRRRRC